MDIYKVENWLRESDIRKTYGPKTLKFLKYDAESEQKHLREFDVPLKENALKTRYGWLFNPSYVENAIAYLGALEQAAAKR